MPTGALTDTLRATVVTKPADWTSMPRTPPAPVALILAPTLTVLPAAAALDTRMPVFAVIPAVVLTDTIPDPALDAVMPVASRVVSPIAAPALTVTAPAP